MIEGQAPCPEPGGESRSDCLVLTRAPLRARYDRLALSRYDDEHWDLSPAVFRENTRRCHCTVRFDALPDPAMEAAMRHISMHGSTYAFQAGHPPATRQYPAGFQSPPAILRVCL